MNPQKPDILFQDQDLLIINKPPNLLSIPDGYDPGLPHLRGILQPEFGELWMVHRLDKETSGVMVLARNADAHRALNEAFKQHQFIKKYHGLVAPLPDWREKLLEQPLQVNADRKHRTRVNTETGKPARTYCQVVKWFDTAVLLEIEIQTAIPHQIRAHLRDCGMALLGDTLYHAGLEPDPVPVPRMMLHARELAFPHPLTGEPVHYTAPYPEDFRAVYTILRTTKSLDAYF